MLFSRHKPETKQTLRVSTRTPLQQVIFEGLHESAMRDAMVLFYNKPLLDMQKKQGVLPKRACTLETIYNALVKKAFESRRLKLALPRATSHQEIAKAAAQHLN